MRFRKYGAGIRSAAPDPDEDLDLLLGERSRRADEPTKRELREALAQAVRNTAAMQKGK